MALANYLSLVVATQTLKYHMSSKQALIPQSHKSIRETVRQTPCDADTRKSETDLPLTYRGLRSGCNRDRSYAYAEKVFKVGLWVQNAELMGTLEREMGNKLLPQGG
ncbi:hypothetical protein AnigIFM59636_002403 [Aspergillus niger]|nr:hypothetical protein AnigIFM59636_002403 [Aspergillus niger]